MSEKKYLLTESELLYSPRYPFVHSSEWLEAHEYHERTVSDIERDAILAKMNGIPLPNLSEAQKDMIRPYVEHTCRMETDGEQHKSQVYPGCKQYVWFCSECGSPTYNDVGPNFCIYCGAKVVDE